MMTALGFVHKFCFFSISCGYHSYHDRGCYKRFEVLRDLPTHQIFIFLNAFRRYRPIIGNYDRQGSHFVMTL